MRPDPAARPRRAGGDKGLPAPVTERWVINQPLSARSPVGGPGHVCFQPSLIQQVSSGKPMRSSICAMKGWRCVIRICLWRATLARFCSSTWTSFFVCQPEPPEEPPDRVGINADITLQLQSRGHFLKRDLAPGIHHPSAHAQSSWGVSFPMPGLPRRFGASAPVCCVSLTMSLTNLTETSNRAAAERCVLLASTCETTRRRSLSDEVCP